MKKRAQKKYKSSTLVVTRFFQFDDYQNQERSHYGKRKDCNYKLQSERKKSLIILIFPTKQQGKKAESSLIWVS